MAEFVFQKILFEREPLDIHHAKLIANRTGTNGTLLSHEEK